MEDFLIIRKGVNMSETVRMIPKPEEFFADGWRFVQYGMSPVRMAALRSAERKAAKGTRKNPIIKDGKEYIYTSDGHFVVLEHLDRETVGRNKLSAGTALTKEKVQRLKEFEAKPEAYDDDCPELSDDEISEIMQEAIAQGKAKNKRKVP